MSARQIVATYTDGRMCARPEFYSGRGAILSDLNSELLEMIHVGIRQEINAAAAEEFIKMVVGIDVLSATLFLNSLYALEAGQWRWTSAGKSKPSDHIDVGPDDGGRAMVGLASMASWMMGGSDRDETFMIRWKFLSDHGRAEQIVGNNGWPL